MIELTDFTIWVWLIILAAAFLSSVLHGATGMAGGVVMVAILSHIIGIKAAIAVMTTGLIFSHCSRVFFYWRETNFALATRVLVFGFPSLLLGAIVFKYLDADIVAIIFVGFLMVSFPIKYWARHHKIKTSPAVLSVASVVWGLLAGNIIGPGFFLAPFLQGTGINRLTFVGTLATITLIMNIIKLTVFGLTAVVTLPLFILGVIVGLVSIPGNWVGKRLLVLLGERDHRLIVDFLTAAVIINFFWLAIT